MVNDDFNTSDSIVPESDDRIGRGKAYTNRTLARDSDAVDLETSSNKNHINRYKIVCYSLAVVVTVFGYFILSQGTELNRLQKSFNKLEANIISTDITAQLGEQDSKLDKHWSEIKKLWGIAYDRNSKSIKKIKTSVAYQKQDIDSINSKLEKSNKSMNSLVNSSLATKLEVNDLVLKIGSQSEKSLEARILENEKAIKAIDAHRLSINRDIQQLKSQLTK